MTFSYFGLQLESTHSMWMHFSYFGLQLEYTNSMWTHFYYFGIGIYSKYVEALLLGGPVPLRRRGGSNKVKLFSINVNVFPFQCPDLFIS